MTALLDAHDALVRACIDSTLMFDVFILAYDGFPHNYPLDARKAANEEERAGLALFRKRIAFHLRIAGTLPRAGGDESSGRFVSTAALHRIRELAAAYPEFQAEPDFKG